MEELAGGTQVPEICQATSTQEKSWWVSGKPPPMTLASAGIDKNLPLVLPLYPRAGRPEGFLFLGPRSARHKATGRHFV